MALKKLTKLDIFYIKRLYEHEQDNMDIDELNSIVTEYKSYKVKDKHRQLYREVKKVPDLLEDVLNSRG